MPVFDMRDMKAFFGDSVAEVAERLAWLNGQAEDFIWFVRLLDSQRPDREGREDLAGYVVPTCHSPCVCFFDELRAEYERSGAVIDGYGIGGVFDAGDVEELYRSVRVPTAEEVAEFNVEAQDFIWLARQFGRTRKELVAFARVVIPACYSPLRVRFTALRNDWELSDAVESGSVN